MRRHGSRSAATVVVCCPLLAAVIQSACARPSTSSEAYAPGLGEIMTLQQMRHVKLWLAGEAGNWDLASYEIKELGEGFDDVVKFHPTHEDSPVAPKDAIPRMMTAALGDVQSAVAKKDAQSFEQAYDALTAACNRCHQATNFSFNVVQRPAMNPYPNQNFAPVASSR
jgi:cytochrome c553